ncbi:MAG: ATP-grasp domain-containing protein [Planctomycetota bacterium]
MPVKLFYDTRDDPLFEQRGMRNLYWLDDIGAVPFEEAAADDEGFLFTGARSIDDYRQLIANHPRIRDRPVEREPLLTLDRVLKLLDQSGGSVPRPRTWTLRVETALPDDLVFPLFVRTAKSSWKLGGKVSKVETREELLEEAAALRRVFGWDETILCRQWLEIEKAGDSMYGPIPVEVRCWIIDELPFAWSFHHLHAAPHAKGFPLSESDLKLIQRTATSVGQCFRSRLVCADFVKLVNGQWVFLEAGPGSCAGTGHEQVFKAVALRLAGEASSAFLSTYGGTFTRVESID